MNTLKLILLFLILYSSSRAQQNLVPNPSFEDTVYCGSYPYLLSACEHWQSYGGSSDYLNTCTPIVGVPYNFGRGFQFPRSGAAMTGLATYRKPNSPCGIDCREFIGCQLIQPLIIGNKYYISFFANNSFTFGIATNKLGLKFSTVPFDSCCKPPLTNSAALYTDSVIIDTVAWFRLSGSFIADSSYNYMMIGNFFDDQNTDTIEINQLRDAGYYYIDDVCVSADSLFNELWTSILDPQIFTRLHIFPNPNSGKFTIHLNEPAYAYEIYSIEARLITRCNKLFFEKMEIDAALNSGVYILKIYSGSKTFTSLFIVNL